MFIFETYSYWVNNVVRLLSLILLNIYNHIEYYIYTITFVHINQTQTYLYN